MASTKEIKNRINSVKDTQKITNAMYLIASTKLRKARRELEETKPYFHAVETEIKRLFRISNKLESVYFYPPSGERDLPGAYGYLVITADKGLAGSYNQSVIRKAEEMMAGHEDNRLFVVGEYGRHYFDMHHIPIEKSFLYTAQNPTFHRAREIRDILLEEFLEQKLRKIFIIYTDYGNGLMTDVKVARILPFHRSNFITPAVEKKIENEFEFRPSMEQALNHIVPSYLAGYIFSALVDSFCSEQNARMNAMDSANQNAEKLLSELSMQYQHARQAAITREITEIAAGARAKKRAMKRQNRAGGTE